MWSFICLVAAKSHEIFTNLWRVIIQVVAAWRPIFIIWMLEHNYILEAFWVRHSHAAWIQAALLPILTSARSCCSLLFIFLVIISCILCHRRMTLAHCLTHSFWQTVNLKLSHVSKCRNPPTLLPPKTTLSETCHRLPVVTTATSFPRSIKRWSLSKDRRIEREKWLRRGERAAHFE